MEIKGKVAVVTGAASGIGKATAVALAQEGADVVLADINEERLAEAKGEIEALGRRVLTVPLMSRNWRRSRAFSISRSPRWAERTSS